MFKKSIRYFIVLLLMIFFANFVEAKKVPGYIITENLDTIQGQIKLSKFNLQTGGWYIYGINIEQLHFEVWFRDNKSKRFRSYKATDILSFGFNYRSINYIFRSFTIESNTRVVRQQKRQRFLQLLYNTDLELYRDTKSMLSNINYVDFTYNKKRNYLLTYYDLYLYSNANGLTKVELSKNVKTVHQLLRKYNLDKRYVKEIPANTKLKDIKTILVNYDLWLKYNRRIKIATMKTLANN